MTMCNAAAWARLKADLDLLGGPQAVVVHARLSQRFARLRWAMRCDFARIERELLNRIDLVCPPYQEPPPPRPGRVVWSP